MLSILIFTKNRNHDLEELLSSINIQKIKINYEIIIIDNSTNFLAKSLSKKFDTTYFQTSLNKLSSVFNFGWKKCNFNNILFLADDVFLKPDWFENSKKYILNSDYDILGGPILSTSHPAGLMHHLFLKANNSFLLKYILKFYLYFSFDKDPKSPGMLCSSGSYTFGSSIDSSLNYGVIQVDLLTTSTMLIKKDILSNLSGFNEIFKFNHADGDLFVRAKKNNFQILFDSSLISYHKVKYGPSRNPYNISRDTMIFYLMHINPKNFKHKVGSFMNLFLILLLYLKQSILGLNLDLIKSLFGFLIGIFDFSKSKFFIKN